MRAYAEIIPIYERRLAERPDSTYFVPLANAYRAVGRHLQAVETLKQGLELHPDYLGARAALAAAYHGAGLYEEAEEEARGVLAAQPENLLARRLLIAYHRERGRLEEALDETRQLIRLAPEDMRPQAVLEELEGLLARQAEEAVATEVPPAEEPPAEPTEPEPTETLAELYAEQGYLEEAIAVYHSLLEKEPESEPLRRRLEALEAELAASKPPEPVLATEEAAEEEALAALVDDDAAVEEIHGLFPSEPPEEEEDDPTAHVIATLEGWLDSLERSGGSPPAGR
jgi:tetratricopeptide (TPR) repeat protein